MYTNCIPLFFGFMVKNKRNLGNKFILSESFEGKLQLTINSMVTCLINIVAVQ